MCLVFISGFELCVCNFLYLFRFTCWFEGLCFCVCVCVCVWLIWVYFLLQSAQSLYYNKEIMKRTLGRPTYAFEARQYIVSVWKCVRQREYLCMVEWMCSWNTFLTDITSFSAYFSLNAETCWYFLNREQFFISLMRLASVNPS